LLVSSAVGVFRRSTVLLGSRLNADITRRGALLGQKDARLGSIVETNVSANIVLETDLGVVFVVHSHGSTHGSHFAAHSSHHASEHDDVSEDGEDGAAEDIDANKNGVGPWEVLLLDGSGVRGTGKKSGLVEARLDVTVVDRVIRASVIFPTAHSLSNGLESSLVFLVDASIIALDCNAVGINPSRVLEHLSGGTSRLSVEEHHGISD